MLTLPSLMAVACAHIAAMLPHDAVLTSELYAGPSQARLHMHTGSVQQVHSTSNSHSDFFLNS